MASLEHTISSRECFNHLATKFNGNRTKFAFTESMPCHSLACRTNYIVFQRYNLTFIPSYLDASVVNFTLFFVTIFNMLNFFIYMKTLVASLKHAMPLWHLLLWN